MEITFSRTAHFSLTVKPKKLADHLDITVRELNRLVEDGELESQYGDDLRAFIEEEMLDAEETNADEIEIEDVSQ